MNKNVLIGIIAVLVVAVLAVGGYILLSGNNDEANDNNVDNGNNNSSNDNQNEGNNDTNGNGSNILVVYFSAQGHTEAVAEQIAENLGADLFEIVPADPYTSDDLDWTDNNSRVSREHDDEALRDELVSTTVGNWEDYDTVIIGYPIWWGIAAWPVNTFVEANDFSGKTVIPFCTSSSSGLGQSGELLAELAGTGNWQEGIRFRSNPSDEDIRDWTDSLF